MTGLFERPAPRWFTIPPHRPFLHDLAVGVLREVAVGGPEAVAAALILLPTRRAARELPAAFLAAGGGRAAVLPQIRVLGDLDEGEPPFEVGDIALDLPPAIAPGRRRYELARLVLENQGLLGRSLHAAAALDLADALGAFLDAWQIEECGDADAVDAVDAVAGGALAGHWQVSADFLGLALRAWPARLAALGLMDVSSRRVALLRRLAERWRDQPPATPVLAAGSTGSAPATAALIAAVGAAPVGAVVLPGLDRALADEAWKEIGEAHEAHPQAAFKRLLERSGVARGDVVTWDPAAEGERRGRWRRRLINEALRPPQSTADWLPLIRDLRAEGQGSGIDPIAEGMAGLSLITARDEDEAAGVAALLMRESLEAPPSTCALVTPDVALARRVRAQLRRWDIEVDVSSGRTLASVPAAVLAALLARAVADPLDPVRLLAIAKHPLVRLGMEPGARRVAVRALERHGLRGLRPAGWEDLAGRLTARDGQPQEASLACERLRATLELAASPFTGGAASVPVATATLAAALEQLARGPDGGEGRLWGAGGGEGLARLLSAVIEESGVLGEVTAAGFAEFLEGLLDRETLRDEAAAVHPRLRILGVLEARLLHADRLILAGLEEGVWPAGAGVDPFLSRPMRAQLGLPPPERRIGLSAHDFAQAAGASEVVLITRERRDGAPAVTSRWLWRLRTLAAGAGLAIPDRPEVLAWVRAIDAPIAEPPPALRPALRPAPRPPVDVRPRKLPVTAVEQWVRDPYGLYARRILGLRPLDLPDAPAEARLRGSAIHDALERFAVDWPNVLPPDPEDAFVDILMAALRTHGVPRVRLARERALARNLAPWIIAFEGQRRAEARLVVEVDGALVMAAPGGDFVLTARADRLEVRGEIADILDFKTGVPPSQKMVDAGLSPQLTLTGAILMHGGFGDLGPLTPGELLYVQITGGRRPGRVEARDGGDAAGRSLDALAGLARRVAAFDRQETAYVSWARPQFIRTGGDYDHLARVWEWRVVGDTGGGDAS
jgi:ATP-dependent helicase/nuclease subunit B